MMRGLFLIPVLAVLVLVAACSPKAMFGRSTQHWKEQDFKPYLAGESYSFPTAYGTESWAYPEGTATAEIIRRWQEAGLVVRVTRGGRSSIFSTPRDVLTVFVGPNFYNLSDSSRRGFAQSVGQIYGAESYLLYDSYTGRGVGVYTMRDGLYTY